MDKALTRVGPARPCAVPVVEPVSQHAASTERPPSGPAAPRVDEERGIRRSRVKAADIAHVRVGKRYCDPRSEGLGRDGSDDSQRRETRARDRVDQQRKCGSSSSITVAVPLYATARVRPGEHVAEQGAERDTSMSAQDFDFLVEQAKTEASDPLLKVRFDHRS